MWVLLPCSSTVAVLRTTAMKGWPNSWFPRERNGVGSLPRQGGIGETKRRSVLLARFAPASPAVTMSAVWEK